jgi:glycosyltransferase involved in cell wall biosynthesis
MASGMPIITTNYSGSIVRNGSEGFIVPAGNAKVLREKMTELKYNLLLRKKMGECSQSLVSHYTWDDYARSVVEVYNKLIF